MRPTIVASAKTKLHNVGLAARQKYMRSAKINTTTRYVFLVLFLVLSLHSMLSFTHEDYGRATSLSHIAAQVPWASTPKEASSEHTIPLSNVTARANATLLMLARNSDVEGAAKSVRELEDKFNRQFGYPWVFLNEVEFTQEFKRRMTNIVSGPISFGVIPHDHWYQPDWIDEEKAKANRLLLIMKNIIYGGSVSYRNMCRFNSGFFYRHPLLQQYKWYWRVEPDVHFHCNIDSDPFKFMEANNKVYGFTITPYEFRETIPTLWDTVKKFTTEHPEYVSEDNAMNYLSDDGGTTYNLCHFWSNFEIASMDFWRSEAYSKFFDYLDATGGFYYERWGDAPVHSIGAGLFARKDQIHFFSNIGYEHAPFMHCPYKPGQWEKGKCACNTANNFDFNGYSCMPQWNRIQ